MTKPIILKAKDFDDLEDIAKPFIDNRYKILSSDSRHILLKKRNYGNRYIHILFLFLILFIVSYTYLLVIYLLCILYMAYFSYYILKKSQIVLITTDTTDKDGNPVEFDDIESVNLIYDI